MEPPLLLASPLRLVSLLLKRAAILPSLSAKSRLDTYLARTLRSGWVAPFQGLLLDRHPLCRLDWRTSRVLPECLRCCQRPNPFVVIEQICCGVFKKINCALRRKRHSSGRSPITHSTFRTSRTLNMRLLRPVPAKAMIASRCSCRSSEGAGDVSLMAPRVSLHLPPPQAARAACAHSPSVGCVPRLRLPVLPLFSCAPRREAQALLPRCSSVCGRIVFFSLFCCPVCCWPRIHLMRSCTSPAFHSCRRRFNSAFLSSPLGTSASFCRQRSRQRMDRD